MRWMLWMVLWGCLGCETTNSAVTGPSDDKELLSENSPAKPTRLAACMFGENLRTLRRQHRFSFTEAKALTPTSSLKSTESKQIVVALQKTFDDDVKSTADAFAASSNNQIGLETFADKAGKRFDLVTYKTMKGLQGIIFTTGTTDVIALVRNEAIEGCELKRFDGTEALAMTLAPSLAEEAVCMHLTPESATCEVTATCKRGADKKSYQCLVRPDADGPDLPAQSVLFDASLQVQKILETVVPDVPQP